MVFRYARHWIGPIGAHYSPLELFLDFWRFDLGTLEADVIVSTYFDQQLKVYETHSGLPANDGG